MSSSPPSIDCSSSQRASPGGALPRSNVAAISARSAPWRIISGPPRPPASSCRASTSIDLPAPVSPVSTVSPARSSSSMASMMAKSRTAKRMSIGRGSGGSALGAAAPPVELGAQQAVIVVTGRVQQRDPLTRRLDLQPVPGSDLAENRSVAGDLRARVGALQQLDLDRRVRGDNYRAIGERMRADRRDDERIEVRLDDGAAAGEGVGGRAGRGRDDDT